MSTGTMASLAVGCGGGGGGGGAAYGAGVIICGGDVIMGYPMVLVGGYQNKKVDSTLT